MVELEKRGVPTVSWTADGFIRDAHRSAESFGLSALPIATMPEPFTNQPPERIRRMVEASIDQVVAGLTRPPQAGPAESELTLIPDEVLRFTGTDLLDATDRMNRTLLEYGWGDGFPLVPPTRQAVDRMLAGTARRPTDTVCILEPGFGLATVEKIAINAVMAGGRPEHLPVLIAAARCLADPKIYIRNKAMSTGPHAPLLVVNGPIARAIGLNAGCCALGPGAPSYANTVIGRAVRLMMMNIGLAIPGVSDMDTIGSPAKYGMCVAENEAASPWEPYHVELGFDREQSTVTVFFVYGLCELHDFQSTTPERLTDVFCTAATNVAQVGTGLWLIGRRADPRHKVEEKECNFLLLCPEHARLYAHHGWTKATLRKYLYDHARMPFRTLMLPKEPKAMAVAHPELQWLWDVPDTPLPIVETPECFRVAVVGAAAGRGTYFYGAGEPVTKALEG
jgi:hypothetical protein